jgi:uroporphyrin-III C-methyltransferase
MKGRVLFVGAGPGAPDLITVRGLKALQAADVILYDSLIDPALLEGLRAERIFVGKRCGRHSMRQERITRLLGELALAGKTVVRLKGGDPMVLGRTGEEALHLCDLGVPFEVVPGVTSAVSAPALAGIPLTHRGVADAFTVVSAHRRDDAEDFSIPPYAPRRSLVLMMSLRTSPAWSRQLLEAGYPADLPVAFVSGGSTAAQSVIVTTVAGAATQAAKIRVDAPTLAVIGHVVALRARLAHPPPAVATTPPVRAAAGSVA